MKTTNPKGGQVRHKVNSLRLVLTRVRGGGGAGPRGSGFRRIIARGEQGGREVLLHATKGYRTRAK